MTAAPASMTGKPQSRSEQKYQAIVEAAEAVFIRMGFQKTSMDKIAEEAKVSKRTVYNHFSTKDELFHHILVACCDDLFVSTALPYQSEKSLKEQLHEMLDIEWALYASERFVKLARVVIGEYVNTPNFIEQLIEDINKQEGGLKRWLNMAIEDARLQPVDVTFAYEFLSGAVKTFAHNPLMFDQPEPDTQQKTFILDEIVAMFLQRYEMPKT